MTEQYDPPIVIEPPAEASACVIWLHGLGADGNDFVPIVPQLRLPQSLGVRFVFPHAPVMPVTVNGGYRMRAWYDILDVDLLNRPDLDGVARSADYLQQLVARQLASGIALDRLVLAGFSQGGVVALDRALQMADKPAGVLALSTYLARSIGSGDGLEVFQAHGTQDEVVPLTAASAARESLRALGAQVQWQQYPMPHSVHPEEIVAISQWLRERLGSR